MTHDDAAARTSYDDVPYDSHPFAQTHPDHLAALAQLFGLRPPALARCRVLELGCASGGNLIPMALALPEAEFVGVDLSGVQVAQGQQVIDALGLGNVRLLAMSITDVDASLGAFDYVIAHGVYSWVPNPVQEKILAICAAQLSADGVACISYNTLPGWRMRGMIRDLMRQHAMQFGDPGQRVAQARAILDFLARSVPTADSAYGMLLKSELDGLRKQPDHYILHEHLEDNNEPLYFHEFIERAGRHGLQYLAEADISTMLASNFAPEVNDTVTRIAPDVIRQEQLMDFLRNRTFRQTLLVREGHSINRRLEPTRVESMWAAGALRAADPAAPLAEQLEELFSNADGGGLRTSNQITRAAVRVLAQRWPAAMAFDDLLHAAHTLLAQHGGATASANWRDALASDLLQANAAGLVELHAGPSPFVIEPGTRPLASPLARWQAASGLTRVTTLRHDTVSIDANLGRMLQLLDGTHDRDSLYRSVIQWSLARAPAGARPPKALVAAARERVDQALAQIAHCALLMA